jgi:hypothetical protein
MHAPSIVPGVFYSILIAGCVIAFPVAFILLARYKNALIKGMGYSSSSFISKNPVVDSELDEAIRFAELNVIEISGLPDGKSEMYKRLKQTLGYHWIIYGVMVLVFATVISFCYLHDFNSFSIWRLLYCILIFSFPFAHISGMLLANGYKQKIAIYSVVFFFYFSLLYFIWDISPTNGMGFLIALTPVLYYNAIPTIIIILFRYGRIKAVGMFILSFCIISISGPALISYYLETHPDLLKKLSFVFIDAGFSANNTLLVWAVFSLVLTLIIGWLFINLIKVFYTRKWINDIQLTADSYLVLFGITYSIFIFFDSPAYAMVSLLASPAYKFTGLLLMFIFRTRKVKNISPSLLLLRVFALGDDSKNLFERILKHWRYAGSILMISGPDLATTTVEPHEIVSFVSGKLNDSYCESEASIHEKIAKIDTYPDLDGTHRVNEFFCRDNNWKYVLQLLVKHSDIILMDLRKFSNKFKGCRFEIEALVNLVSLDKIIFVIDSHTDLAFTKLVFTQAFQKAESNSDNRHIDQQIVTLYKIDSRKDMDVSSLMNLVCSKIEQR